MNGETKQIAITVSLFLNEGGYWGIRDEVSGDCQTYDDYVGAKQAYDQITDEESLKQVFGWE